MSNTGAIPKGGARPKVIVDTSSGSPKEQYKSKSEGEITGEPLDKKFITINSKGFEKRMPALHICWTEKAAYIKYEPPPLPDCDGIIPPGAQESWLEQMEFFEQDLQYLLSFPHHKFWSQVVYDQGLQECLESYISNGQRWYDDETLDEYSKPVIESIHQLVFLVFVRMSTFKESKTSHITPSVFGDIIYDNFLFDICKLLDLCTLYGPTNSQLLSKMIDNIFSNQPKYYDDLSQTVSSIALALEKVEEKMGVVENNLPLALGFARESLSMSELNDIILYLLDTISSLQMFLTLHQPAAKYFQEAGFEVRLSSCYERVFPTLMDDLSDRSEDSQEQLWAADLVKKIELTRASLLITFRAVLHHKCLKPLSIGKPPPTLVGECVENFLHIMSSCIGDKTFIADYCSAYPVSNDFDVFKEHDADIASLNFISDAIRTVMTEMGVLSEMQEVVVEGPRVEKEEEQSPDDTSGMNGYMESGSAEPTDIELASMVSSVLDLLPELGAGFIQKCLKYYSYSTEDVIHALLEDNLPPSLAELDRTAPAPATVKSPSPPPIPPEDDMKTKADEQDDFMDRANIYNDDEFDVFSKSYVNKNNIRKGKKVKTPARYETDRDEVEKLKEIARQYDERGGTSIYEDEFRYTPEQPNTLDYDDEYDDTYDDNETGDIDDVGVEKFVKPRPTIFGAGRLNCGIEYSSDEKSNEEEKEEVKEDSKKGNNNAVSQKSGNKPKNLGSKRGVQRLINPEKKSSKPKQNSPIPEREGSQETQDRPSESEPNRRSQDVREYDQDVRERTFVNSKFMPFTENPEEVRRRAEQRRQDRDVYRNRGSYGRGDAARRDSRRDEASAGGADGGEREFSSRPKVSLSSNRNSGKNWRQGQGGDDDNRKFHGGKYKEDTNHGKAQSQQHRYKMMHKNEHKRQGAQAKFNRNN